MLHALASLLSFAACFTALGRLKRFSDGSPFACEPKQASDSERFSSFQGIKLAMTVSFLLLVAQYVAMVAFGAAEAVSRPLAVVGVQAALLAASAALRTAAHAAARRDREGVPLMHAYAGGAAEASKQGPVVRSGPYARVRHPFYTSHLLHYAGLYLFAVVATLSAWPHAHALMKASAAAHAAAVLAFAYHMVTSAGREERALRQASPAYAAYAAKVQSRFVPFLW